MREFVILFIENVLKEILNKILDEKNVFFHPTDLGEVIQKMFGILNSNSGLTL